MKILFILAVFAVFLKCYHAKVKEEKAFESDQAIDNIIAKIMQNDDRPTITKRASQPTCNKNLQFPESSNVEIKKTTGVISEPTVMFCHPHPFAVPVPALSHLSIFPTMVQLNRCYGDSLSRLQHCVATKKDELKIEYRDMASGIINQAVMYSHTQCQAECIIKASDCNSAQSYDQNCFCKCNLKAGDCGNTTRHLDEDNCICQCKVTQKCDLYQEWDPVNCKCVCDKCIKEMCKKHNKVLNAADCTCI